MLKTTFDKEEDSFSLKHDQTPLHYASEEGHHEVVKYLIEKGTNVNSIWHKWPLKYQMLAFTLINNFNDPFFQRGGHLLFRESLINILIENGMI